MAFKVMIRDLIDISFSLLAMARESLVGDLFGFNCTSAYTWAHRHTYMHARTRTRARGGHTWFS